MEYEDKNSLQLKRKSKRGLKVLKTEFEIELIGEPDINALPESEQHTFLETLLALLKDLKENTENHD